MLSATLLITLCVSTSGRLAQASEAPPPVTADWIRGCGAVGTHPAQSWEPPSRDEATSLAAFTHSADSFHVLRYRRNWDPSPVGPAASRSLALGAENQVQWGGQGRRRIGKYVAIAGACLATWGSMLVSVSQIQTDYSEARRREMRNRGFVFVGAGAGLVALGLVISR